METLKKVKDAIGAPKILSIIAMELHEKVAYYVNSHHDALINRYILETCDGGPSNGKGIIIDSTSCRRYLFCTTGSQSFYIRRNTFQDHSILHRGTPTSPAEPSLQTHRMTRSYPPSSSTHAIAKPSTPTLHH